MDRLNIGGSFAEFHPFDFAEDFILVGDDGSHHLGIVHHAGTIQKIADVLGIESVVVK